MAATPIRKTTARRAHALLLGGLLCGYAGAAAADPPASASAPAPAPASASASASASAPASASASASAPAPASASASASAAPPKTTATITFVTVPPATALVTWGKTRLGRITADKALVIVRPRDSGPLDVIVRAEGFLPVQTRAHTFADTRVSVKLTRPEETNTLLGYRQPVPPPPAETPADAVPDQGVGPVVAPEWNMTAPENMTPATPAVTPATPLVPPASPTSPPPATP